MSRARGWRTRRRVLLGAGVVLLLLLAGGLAYAVPLLRAAGPAANGYAAKTVCSGVHVAGRPAADVEAEFPDNPLRPFLRVEVDGPHVRSTLLGTFPRRAVHRPGLGCALLPGDGDGDGLPPAPSSVQRPETAPLPAAPPGTADERRLAAALDAAFAEPDPEHLRRTRAVVVLHEGRLVAERYAPGFSAESRMLGWSMAKSVQSALVGIAVGDGLLDPADDRLLPAWTGEEDGRAAITLDHLLHMSSGLAFEEDYADPTADAVQMLFAAPDAAAVAVEQPLVHDPGTAWSYSSGTTNIVSELLRRAVGDDEAYLAFPAERLFGPAGMSSAVLETDPSGTFVGSSFLYATARDWARFGQLHLDDGTVAGPGGERRRVLPEGWVERVTTPAPAAPQGSYGSQWWLNAGAPGDVADRPWPSLPPDTYAAQGHEGQLVFVVPSRDVVVVRLGLDVHDRFDAEAFVTDVLTALPG